MITSITIARLKAKRKDDIAQEFWLLSINCLRGEGVYCLSRADALDLLEGL